MSDISDLKRFVTVANFVGKVILGAAGGRLVVAPADPHGGVEPDPVISPTAQTVLVGLCIRELATTLGDKESARQLTDLSNNIIREAIK